MADKGFYQILGKSDNTKQNVKVGSILRVASEDINRFETDDPDRPYFRAYVSVVLQSVPERKSPDRMLVVQRLATLTPRRESLIAKMDELEKVISLEDYRIIRSRSDESRSSDGDGGLKSDVKESIKAESIPKAIYQRYAKENQPLPHQFYTNYQEGDAWAQTHIRGLEPDQVKAYEAKQMTLAELFKGHSIHIDLRMKLGQEKLIQWVILDNDIPSYLRYLRGESRETAGGTMNVQHSMAVVKPSAEEPSKLEKAEERKEPTISRSGARELGKIQMPLRSYFIPPGGIGATRNTASWMGLIWIGKVKAGIQRKDYHEYFLIPGKMLPDSKKLFNGRFVFKCLKRKGGTARWETWKAATDSKPADPILHADSGYYYPVKADQVNGIGREKYQYGKKEPQ